MHNSRHPERAARGYLLFLVALAAAALWAAVVLPRLDDPVVRAEAFDAGGVNVLVGLGMALSGLFLIARGQPRALGWLLLAGGTGRVLADAVPAAVTAVGTASPALTAAALPTAAATAVYYLALYTVPLLLPQGRLPRRGGAACCALLAGLSAVQAVRDTVLAGDWYSASAPPTGGLWSALERLDLWRHPLMRWTPTAAVGACLAVMVVRRWRSPGVHLRAGLLVPYLVWLGMWLFGDYLYPFDLPEWGTDAIWYAAAAVWPAALGYTAVRDRSRHLDRSARRVLSTLLLATGLVTAYLAATVLIFLAVPGSAALRALVLGGLAAPLGALVQPTARWSARAVDRYYYGERARPYQSVRALSERLSRAVDPAEAPRVLCATAVHTLGLPGARLVVHRPGGTRELAALGVPVTEGRTFPLIHRGAVIGHLLVAPRPGERTLDGQDTEAVRLLAAHAAPAVAAVRLYEDLHESHAHLLRSREEERRLLRRELHDGLGPTLSGLRLRIDLVRSRCPGEQTALLAASDELGQAVDELRRITHGLAPGALDSCDLTTALRQLTDRLTGPALRIGLSLRPEPLPSLPGALETAVYRIAAEALNNAVRHARADRARLSVTVLPDTVRLDVTDNGRGLPTGDPTGIGLRSMTERAAELGGSVRLTSGERGTTVHAALPVNRQVERVKRVERVERVARNEDTMSETIGEPEPTPPPLPDPIDPPEPPGPPILPGTGCRKGIHSKHVCPSDGPCPYAGWPPD